MQLAMTIPSSDTQSRVHQAKFLAAIGTEAYLEGHDCAPDMSKHIGVEADMPLKDIQVALMQDPTLDCATEIIQECLHQYDSAMRRLRPTKHLNIRLVALNLLNASPQATLHTD